MNTPADSRPSGVLSRRLVFLVGIVLLAIPVAGTLFWFVHRSPKLPAPPPVPSNPAEPHVKAFLDKVREQVVKEPHSARAWGALGQAFLANDMEAESQVCFAAAERLDPDDLRWPYFQAGILLNQGERETALPFLQHAVELGTAASRDHSVPQLMLAETLLALGRLEEAEENFRQVLAQHGDDARVNYGLGLLASARQDWPTSRAYLLRCLGHPAAQQKACVQLAAVSQFLGKTADAEKFRRQASRLPPDQDWDDPYATEYLAWAVTKRNRFRRVDSLEAAGRLREATAVLRPMLAEYPDDYLPRLSLGKILGRLGEPNEAAQLLREALQLAPEKIQGHYYLSLVLFTAAEEAARRGERSRAERLYRESVQQARETLALKPDYGFAYMPLGLSLKALGQRADALTALRQAVRCNPEHAELHFYLGDLLAEAGQSAEARAQLQQAIDMAPANASWKSAAQKKLTTESQRTQRKTQKREKN